MFVGSSSKHMQKKSERRQLSALTDVLLDAGGHVLT